MILKIIKQNLPNTLTFFRLFSVPFFVIIFYFDNNLTKLISAILFSICSLSDFLDGFLARHWQVESKLGGIFDPIADKLIVIAAIVMLIYHQSIPGIHIFAAISILLREVIISGLREALSTMKIELKSSKLGKFKTLIQLSAITLLIFSLTNLLEPKYAQILHQISLQILWIAAFLSIYSGYEYIKKTIKYLN